MAREVSAEVLHQAKNSNVIEGGWVGGDAWFGSIASCVELKHMLSLYSTFIIKQNVNFFLMKLLHSILLVHHGTHLARHWVVITTTIAEVDLYATAYAWLSKGVAYMVSTCGKTVQHEKASVTHFLHEFLPLIDEHNKARQNALALKKCWLTKK